ncbi:MAG: helix-turn-helix transcriptional regulator [Cyanobacteriota/Melainabacteria group bacterium]
MMMSKNNHKKTKNAGDILRRRYLEKDPELASMVEDHMVNLKIAQQIYDLRIEANLTQKDLAEKINTTPSVISRLEDADYDGHSLSMLKKIASVLGKRLKVEFVDKEDQSLQAV